MLRRLVISNAPSALRCARTRPQLLFSPLSRLRSTAAAAADMALPESGDTSSGSSAADSGEAAATADALPLLRKSKAAGGASVINFGSYDGFIADPGLAAYCATKGAVHALTRAMACDHGPEGIRVNAICPGYVDTPMLQSFFEGEGSGGDGGTIDSLQQAVRDVHPMRTYGTPDDMANLVNWLASDEARYAAGQLWVLDGGLSAQVQQMKL